MVGNEGTRRGRSGAILAALCLLSSLLGLSVGGAALWRTLTPHSPDGLQPGQRLASLKGALGPDLPGPQGAALVSRTESAGNNLSDGPSVEWQYRFDGPQAAFVDLYRVALAERGWIEERPGNAAGELINFGKTFQGVHHGIAIFAPGDNPNFRLMAFD